MARPPFVAQLVTLGLIGWLLLQSRHVEEFGGHMRSVPSSPVDACVPFQTAFELNPSFPKMFFAFNTVPSFPFVVRTDGKNSQLYSGMVNNFARLGGYTEGVYVFLQQTLSGAPKGGLVVDLGGNFGVVSTYVSLLGHRVVAVEGDPKTAEVWRFNVLLNCASAATLIESFISDKEESIPFIEASVAGGSHMSKSGSGGVRALPLDVLLPLHWTTRPLVLKADIEGFERYAFAGATKFLSRFPPYYIVWESTLEDLEVFSILASYRYTFYFLGDGLGYANTHPQESGIEIFNGWFDRPIDVKNVRASIASFGASLSLSDIFDTIAVHPDQLVGCPANVTCH